MGEEGKRRRIVSERPLSNDNLAELERLREENKKLRMESISREKWRPGSRRRAVKIRCHRGLG